MQLQCLRQARRAATRLSLVLLPLAAACNRTPAGSTPAASQDSGGVRIDSSALTRLIDSAMTVGMVRESIPGAVFILVRGGRVVLAKGYGKADLASGRPWDPDSTIFPIASITKVFTATAVMQLADQGLIELNTDVSSYLRSVRVPATYAEPITAAHLLSHTAGLDELPGRRVRSPAELVPLSRFLATRLIRIRPPGRVTSYSSYGMALAGLLVEDVSGVSYETYLRQHIWKPLGMTRTSITPPRAGSALATAYEIDNGETLPVPYEMYQTPPASSILSTAGDMGRFLIAHLQNGRSDGNRILSDSAAARMHRQYVTMHPKIPGWTLGFQVNDLNGRYLIEHGGDIGGFSSLLTLLPQEGVGFFVAHHLEGRNLRFDIERLILDSYFPPPPAPKPPPPPPGAAQRVRRFAGTYRAGIYCHSCKGEGPPPQDFTVTANPDGTITLWDDRWVEAGPLYFVSLDGRKRLGFFEDPPGHVLGLTAGSWKVLERVE